MSAYEVMLSESQERMLLVVRPEGVRGVQSVVERWSLHASQVGQVTDDGLVRILDDGTTVAEVPAELLTDRCPTYVRDGKEAPEAVARRSLDLTSLPDLSGESGDGPGSVTDCLLSLLASPNIASRRSIYERYDHTILASTVVAPGAGDAAVLRLRGTGRGIAAAIDCNSRYCALDPYLGAAHAVAEATRNLVCVGARPLAITNCLNFGNPEKPSGYFQLSQVVAGMASACRSLGVPVVSGNVSLYNETGETAVMPTPTIGAVGVLEDVRAHATMRWQEGDVIVLVGGAAPSLGGSEYLSHRHGLTAGSPPPLDLEHEALVQKTVRSAVQTRQIRAAHDCGLGGLAVALAEMAIASGTGAVLEAEVPAGQSGRVDEAWFGEAPGRIVVAGAENQIQSLMGATEAEGIGAVRLGIVGGSRFSAPGWIDVEVAELTVAHASGLPAATE